MATLKELSEHTGYSITTISRVLNNDPTMSVSDATRAAILEAAGALNYKKPSPRQRRDAAGHLCFAVAEMLSPVEQLKDPYYLYLKNHAVQHCLDLGHSTVSLVESDGSYQLMGSEAVNGILAIGIFSEDQIAALSALHNNLVFLDSAPDELRFDSVVINFKLGVEQALDRLVAHGHRRIGFLGPDRKLDERKRPAPEVRRQYFIDFMTAQGLFSPDLLIEAEMTAADAYQTMRSRLQNGGALPTALLTANEEAAFGAMRALREGGLRVPEDMSVIGFNDTPLSELTDPPLTSISTHVKMMSCVAVDLLVQRTHKAHDAVPLKIVVPPMLIERASVSSLTE